MRLSILLLLLVPAKCFQSLSGASAPVFQSRLQRVDRPRRHATLSQQQKQQRRDALQPLQSSVAPSSFSNETVASLSGGADAAARRDLIQRCAVAGLSCVTTWAMVATTTALPVSLSIIQASSIQGLLACAAFQQPAYAAASFCGSFAGMSGQLGGLGEASLLAAACSAVYYWFERPNNKLQLGKGGRLGTIAFLGNVLYLAVRQGLNRGVVAAAVDVLNLLRPSTALAVLVASLGTAVTKNKAVATTDKKTDETTAPSALTKVSSVVAKTALLCVLLARYIATATTTTTTTASTSTSALSVVTQKLVPTTAAMFAASLVVKKSPGIVLPVAVTGLVGSFMGTFAAPIYLGAFIGMTGLSAFGTSQFFQSSLLSTLLLQLGLFSGFGGKLGFLSFLGVNFAM